MVLRDQTYETELGRNGMRKIGLAAAFFGGLALLLNGCAEADRSAADDAPFSSSIPAATERVWVGPDYYANRLLDWRIQDGRIECIEGRPAKPMRTLHLLTRALGEEPGTLSMSVRTGPIEPDAPPHENTWTGFLIGAGGDHVDFRISALVHHWPAPDGGLIVGVDGTGMIIVRDNSGLDGPKRAVQDVPLWAWPLIEPVSVELAPIATKATPSRDFLLRLEAEPESASSSASAGGGEGAAGARAGAQPTYRMTVSTFDAATGDPIHVARYEGIAAEFLSGSVALVSHQSPSQSGPGYWFRDWQVDGTKIVAHPDHAFGPVMGTMHTLSEDLLTLTAQMGPLGPDDPQTAELQIQRQGGNDWETVATGTLADLSYTTTFRVENWDSTVDTPYRVV
jgi:alkaline phosphatase D